MVVHSKLEICNQDKNLIRSFSTKSFTGAKKKEDIETFILKKYPNSKTPFDIEILDQHHGYVTLDDDYLEEYNTFDVGKKDTTTVQPINSSEPSVTLRVTLPDSILFPPTDQQRIVALDETLEAALKEIQTIDRALSMPESPKHLTIPLSKDPRMGFVVGHNVNDKQRDQYVCDEVNVRTGQNTTGTLSMIQGQKGPKNKFQCVLPRFSIRHDGIKNTIDHVWTLLVFIVLDVYQLGRRTLFYHPQRTFVEKDNVTQQMNPYEIPITTMNWMHNMGEKLKMTTVVIERSKTRFNVPTNIICNLEDTNESELFCSSSNYSKSRLALVLRKDNDIQWETLVLSDEMTFQNRNIPAVTNKNIDVLTNTVATSLKREQSDKCETTANKRTKQPKMTTLQGHSSMVNLSTNTNDSSVLHDQSSSIYHGNNQVINIISQTMPNIPEHDLVHDIIFDSTDIGNSSGDLTVIMNILQDQGCNDFANMHDGSVINNDPSLHTTVSSHDDSSDSWDKLVYGNN